MATPRSRKRLASTPRRRTSRRFSPISCTTCLMPTATPMPMRAMMPTRAVPTTPTPMPRVQRAAIPVLAIARGLLATTAPMRRAAMPVPAARVPIAGKAPMARAKTRVPPRQPTTHVFPSSTTCSAPTTSLPTARTAGPTSPPLGASFRAPTLPSSLCWTRAATSPIPSCKATF